MDGDYHYDSRKQTLLWTVDLIDDSNRLGAMEFVLSGAASPDAFFPVDVSFDAQHNLADVKIITVGAQLLRNYYGNSAHLTGGFLSRAGGVRAHIGRRLLPLDA